MQRKSSSNKAKHFAQVNGLQEKNLSSQTTLHNEEQNKLVTSNKADKENEIIEEDKALQQSIEKNDRSVDTTGSQAEATEMT